MIMYHINPKTGMPSICHAKHGNCPYGGKSGREGHFMTYSMAFVESQKRLEKEHALLPTNRKDDEYEKAYEETRLSDDEFELKEHIRNTDDVDLLKDIIEGRLYAEDGWDKVSIALQNPNLPRELIEDILYNRKDYSLEAKRRVMLNPSLTKEDVMNVINNSEDMYSRAIALQNPNIDLNFANDLLENRKEELTRLPWHMIVENPSVDVNKIDDWFSWALTEQVDIDRLEIAKVRSKYRDWMLSHERNKRLNT